MKIRINVALIATTITMFYAYLTNKITLAEALTITALIGIWDKN